MRSPVAFALHAAVAIAASGLGYSSASAQSVEDFYKSHVLTIVVSSGPGGGYDVYSRLLARFLPAHLPGNPHIVIQNMPGADGLTAINYVNNSAPRDGSLIADTYSTMPFYILLNGANARYDAQKINWLGSISKMLSICVAWGGSSFKTLDDAMQRSMRIAATGPLGWRSVLPHLFNLVAGSKFDVVTGYGSGEDYLAVERGEVEGSCTTYDTLLASKSDWITKRQITFLAQFGDEPAPELKDVPLGLNRIENPEDRAAMELILAQQQTGRPYLAPPNVPADRVAALRSAFDATMVDPRFLAAAQQANLWLAPTSSAPMEAVIRAAYVTPAATVARARFLLQKASSP